MSDNPMNYLAVGKGEEEQIFPVVDPKAIHFDGPQDLTPEEQAWARDNMRAAAIEDIPTKPEDIGAQPAGNYAEKEEIPSVPVQSVNGKTGAVELRASDVKARPDNWLPTAQEVGALPSTYTPPNQTAAQVGADPKGTAASAVSQHNTADDSHNDIRLELKAIKDRLTAFFDSDNQTLDEMSEIVSYITSNKTLIDSITTSKVSVADIINNLVTNVANKPLSAAQGVELKTLIDAITVPTKVSQLQNDAGYLTQHQDISGKLDASKLPEAINTALAQAQNSGVFDGKDGRGIKSIVRTSGTGAAGTTDSYTVTYTDNTTSTISVYNGKDGTNGTSVTVSSVTESTEDGGSNVVRFSDDKTLTVKNGKAGTPGKDGLDATPVTPLFANSIEECTDTGKFYVLPDGFIYTYQYVEATGPSYTNLSETVHENYRMNSSGILSALSGAVTTDFIPVKKGQTVRFKGFDPLTMPSGKSPYICFYTGASESTGVTTGYIWGNMSYSGVISESNGVYVYTAFVSGNYDSANGCSGQHESADTITHIRMCGTMLEGETVVVTVDEEITEGGGGGYMWVNTGHAFVPADYEAEILALQNNKADKTAIPTKLPNPNALTIDGVKYDGSSAVSIETQSGGNILYGKKWVACGDSFTHGGYNASDGFDSSVYVYQDGRFAGHNIVYPYIIGLRNNMNIVNLATGGQTMANSSNSFMTRYANIDADADYITIMLGINDKVQGLAVGTLEDSTDSTFCGAFNIAMEHILENHPFAHIGIMVSHGTNEEIMEATRGIAERWGVPYLDYGSPQVSLMNRYTGRNVCAKAQEIREKNFCVISDGITATNGHPNTAAHEYESTFIEAWLRTL